ncbi:phage shock protein PspC (stress-responsive transcriptional regulator) [Pontibacter aydingkolensis]|uniref:PspC domain-containing protein n=1 Tax=Pontibacter aydingkolensis TaxID=1911536 RepID=A0ABS7CY68_9BACT|nr:PspC domain-containing protein [Pontibacter aydingkolensis]MBW7468767.1 PspC domain-containing protein [Pontibacter aydingkolensis]
MKKNISINLQGIIFHIEEDGYEQLSRYLTSIRTYFSNYEGHEEIVADIESRIAEIFSARLNPGKQVISLEDVEYLITRMGNVTDFEVAEPLEEGIPHTGPATGSAYASEGAYTTAGPKKLYRDINRKVIAGVCAGIANYLSIDVVWIRLLFVLLVIGIPFSDGITSFGIILYIVLWIAMPASDVLPETNVKKLFRDPEDKKLAGVASGIAKYFGVDVAVVRIMFLVLIFAGGFGILAYIILWIAVPEAVTLTERMQMQGDPVTLAGIERSLKDNLNMRDNDGHESTLARIILLPIRLISQIFSWLGKSLGPVLAVLITLIRVAAGIILLVVSIGLTIGLFSALFVSLGVINESEFVNLGDFPASVLLGGFPSLGLVAGFFVGLIPLLLLITLAISLLAKRTFMRPIVGWSMFGVWLVALFTLIATIIIYSNNFRRSGEVLTTKTIPVSGYSTLVLDAYDTNLDYDRIYIDVQEHNGTDIEVIQRAEAKGRTEAEAQQNARMITYQVVQKDSVLRFDNSYEFKEGAVFRDQELDLVLRLPRNKPLRLTREFTYLLPTATFDQDYSRDKIVRNTWQVKGDMLECLTCAADTLDTEEYNFEEGSFNEGSDDTNISGSVLLNEREYSSNSKTYNYRDFNSVEISGPYHVELRQGSNYSVRVRGERDDLRRMEIDKVGDELRIGYTEKNINLFSDRDPVLVQITAPDFNDIDLSGAIKAEISGIRADNLRMNFSGAIQSNADVNVRDLRVEISGAAVSKFSGRADNFKLDATGAGKVNAAGLRANTVDVDVTGASLAEVYAARTLRADASGASRIVYAGNPKNTTIDSSGPSSVKRR